MRVIVIAALCMTFLCACGVRPVITQSVLIEPDAEGRHVEVAATTAFSRDVSSRSMEQRQAVMREAILAGRDEWGLRFAAVSPDDEQIVYDRHRGVLIRAEHRALMDIDAIHQFFAGAGFSLQLTRGEGWTELSVFPDTSTRASRAQREHVATILKAWSEDVAHYFAAMARLYEYLDEEPHRAAAVFELLFDDEKQSTIEREDALVRDAIRTMDAIRDRLQSARDDTYTIDEEFDLNYNPFPAEIVVRVPRPIDSLENFEKRDDHTVRISRAGLLDAITSLEGKWLTPDPLAISARMDDGKTPPTAAELAAMPRRATSLVTATDIQREVERRLRPASTYRVRW
jgi:hypothetical protein